MHTAPRSNARALGQPHTLAQKATRLSYLGALALLQSCSLSQQRAAPPPDCNVETPAKSSPLQISEVMSSNDGVVLDEEHETEDWIEVHNTSQQPVELRQFVLADSSNERARLPNVSLDPGQVYVLFADDEPEEGVAHLPFKLSSKGDVLRLSDDSCQLHQVLDIPSLEQNVSFGTFAALSEPLDDDTSRSQYNACRYASPGTPNGSCTVNNTAALPPPPEYLPFDWTQAPAPAQRGTEELLLNELSLSAGGFIELLNPSSSSIALDGYDLRLAPQAPGDAWPTASDGVSLPLPSTVASSGITSVDIFERDLAAMAQDPKFEGVATLFSPSGAIVDRVAFMHWPSGATLSRPLGSAQLIYCNNTSRGSANESCNQVLSRDVGDRLRHIRTPGDFAALARGGTRLGLESVKFVYDMEAGGVVHLLSAERWPLHYTFVREAIHREPALNRCSEQGAREFLAGWTAFSQTEYHQSTGRSYLLGTLVQHGGAKLQTIEFTSGDNIVENDLRRAFFEASARDADPTRWAFRPQTRRQEQTADVLNGSLPIVAQQAPFADQVYQPLTQALTYGTLTYVPSTELDRASLGPDVIVVTDDVPNDIELVAGLITEAFQTPLAHVNVLSQNRGTPNMALREARQHPSIQSHLGQLVRLEVRGSDFSISAASAEQAETFWAERTQQQELLTPRLNVAARNLVPLNQANLNNLPSIGAKAAQIGELFLLRSAAGSSCQGQELFEPPDGAFAIPVVHSLDHLEASGALAALHQLEADAEFRTNGRLRDEKLAELRALIIQHPVEASLLQAVTAQVQSTFGEARLRFRSSSNAEDLPNFNGAGLYTSFSAQLGDPSRSVEDAIRGVWASLYNRRAYDERRYANVQESNVAMGIAVHSAFRAELAQGVAISRNLLDPTQSDVHYINTQAGEASVTNPAPGIVTEQLAHQFASRIIDYRSHSNLVQNRILSQDEIAQLSCSLDTIHKHYQTRIDPEQKDRLFAMEVEFKLLRPDRRLVIKQARPHRFGTLELSSDCREL